VTEARQGILEAEFRLDLRHGGPDIAVGELTDATLEGQVMGRNTNEVYVRHWMLLFLGAHSALRGTGQC
jgi:hypothetical protein